MDIFKPVEVFSNYIVYNLFQVKSGTHLKESLEFFIYDVIKIFILILLISFVVGFIKSYLNPEKLKNVTFVAKLANFFLFIIYIIE